MSDSRTCCVPGCGRLTKPYRALCEGHRARKRRGRDLEPPLRARHPSLLQRARNAGMAYADAGDDDRDYDRADARMRMVLRDAKRCGATKTGATPGDTGPEKES